LLVLVCRSSQHTIWNWKFNRCSTEGIRRISR